MGGGGDGRFENKHVNIFCKLSSVLTFLCCNGSLNMSCDEWLALNGLKFYRLIILQNWVASLRFPDRLIELLSVHLTH